VGCGSQGGRQQDAAGRALGHANVGYTYVGRGGVRQDDQFTSGVALEGPLGPHFALVGEALADTNRRTAADRHSDWVAETRAGFRVRWGGFLLSVAGRKGLTNDAPDWGVFALVTYTPPEKPAAGPAWAPPPRAARCPRSGRPASRPRAPGAPAVLGGPGVRRCPRGPRRPAPRCPGALGPRAPGAPDAAVPRRAPPRCGRPSATSTSSSTARPHRRDEALAR
jgi:hypothetical protein